MSTDNKDWNVINDGAYGQVFEKKDGSVIITATWDGKGFKYTSHYPPKALNEDTIQSKDYGVGIPLRSSEMMKYTQSEVDTIRTNIWWAARVKIDGNYVFNFLEDYIKTLTQ